MPSCFSCFGPSRGPSSASTPYSQAALPADYNELDRHELKALYDRSIALNSGRLIVHGIFARADTKNNNKRVYPKALLCREAAKFEQERIVSGTALGELDHPNYASRYFKCLNLANVSHQVLEVHWKGNQLWGSIEVLPTPAGLLLWELYSQGIKLGVSSRGWASLLQDPARDCVLVDQDFELITFDFVTEPSTKDAYLVPLQRTFPPQNLPNQKKVVQLAHLGHGVCSMDRISKLPPSSQVAARIADYRAQLPVKAVAAAGTLREPDVAMVHCADQQYGQSRPQNLDDLLLYSHYIVDQDAGYLKREKDARNFQGHLAMFASRAHLWNQQHGMSKADLNALIMQEVAQQDVGVSTSAHKAQPQGAQGFMHLAECQGQQADEMQGWPMYPHATPGTSSAAASSGGGSNGARFGRTSSRVHPSPLPSAPLKPQRGEGQGQVQQVQEQSQRLSSSAPRQVLQELQRIKATLAHHATTQQRMQQQYLLGL